MGVSGGIMAGSSAVSSGLGAYSQASAQRAQGQYQSEMAQVNAGDAELRGEDAIRIGDDTAKKVQKQAEGVVGAQRAALGASGVEVDSGSALTVQQDTREQAQIAGMEIKNNAWREAWGFKEQATQATFAGQMAQFGANNAANSTLLTGGLKAAQYGYQAGRDFNQGSSYNPNGSYSYQSTDTNNYGNWKD